MEKLVRFSLTWVHPSLQRATSVRVDDARLAQKLSSIFEGYDQPAEGMAYDCPMYDVIVYLHAENGHSTELNVYLPRVHIFPGMWKHPSGPLFYFEVSKSQPKLIVEMLRPYMPTNAVYPTEIKNWPSVPFNKGIPDFRNVNLPIDGNFSPDEFS